MNFAMEKETIKAIAHIYAGIMKADGVLSDEELVESKLNKILRFYSKNISYLDGHEAEPIRKDLIEIVKGNDYTSWDTEKHLAKAMTIIEKNSSEIDDIAPILETMKAIAKLDELTIYETRFIKLVEKKLEEARTR